MGLDEDGTGQAEQGFGVGEDPSDPDVYHDYDDCPTGQQISSWNKRPGTGGYPRCKQCTAKGLADQMHPGAVPSAQRSVE